MTSTHDTHLARPDVAAVVARWHGDPRSVAHLRDGENAVYRFTTAGTPRILRLGTTHHRSDDQLEAELAFIRFVASRELQASGLAVACPVASDSGAWVETVTADDGSDSGWRAVVFEEARGRHFEFFSSDIDRPLFQKWGRAMGALHTTSREFRPARGRQRVPWSALEGTRCDVAGLSSSEVAARREHARLLEWLAGVGATSIDWGLIHGDFERTNFALDGDALRLYDFDDACYHWYVADIAHALWVFRGAPAADRTRFLAFFLDGYRERSEVNEAFLEDFSWFIRLRSLSLYLGRARPDVTGAPRAVNATWERRMRSEFEYPFRW